MVKNKNRERILNPNCAKLTITIFQFDMHESRENVRTK